MTDNAQFRNRGPLLTGWILLVILSNFSLMLIAVIIILLPERSIIISTSIWMFILLFTVTVVNIVSGIAIWKWKKLGIYGFIGVITVSGLVLVASGFSFGRFLFSWLFNIGILLALVIPKWNQFE